MIGLFFDEKKVREKKKRGGSLLLQKLVPVAFLFFPLQGWMPFCLITRDHRTERMARKVPLTLSQHR
jgi:hypothetical protein